MLRTLERHGRRRVALATAVAAALATAGTAIAATTRAVTPGGTYAGRTAAHEPVTLKVDRTGKHVTYTIHWLAAFCDGGRHHGAWRDSTVGHTTLRKNGSFDFQSTYSGHGRWGRKPASERVHAHILGTIGRRVAHGNFHATVQIFQHGRRTHVCETIEDNTFTVHLR